MECGCLCSIERLPSNAAKYLAANISHPVFFRVKMSHFFILIVRGDLHLTQKGAQDLKLILSFALFLGSSDLLFLLFIHLLTCKYSSRRVKYIESKTQWEKVRIYAKNQCCDTSEAKSFRRNWTENVSQEL